MVGEGSEIWMVVSCGRRAKNFVSSKIGVDVARAGGAGVGVVMVILRCVQWRRRSSIVGKDGERIGGRVRWRCENGEG